MGIFHVMCGDVIQKFEINHEGDQSGFVSNFI